MTHKTQCSLQSDTLGFLAHFLERCKISDLWILNVLAGSIQPEELQLPKQSQDKEKKKLNKTKIHTRKPHNQKNQNPSHWGHSSKAKKMTAGPITWEQNCITCIYQFYLWTLSDHWRKLRSVKNICITKLSLKIFNLLCSNYYTELKISAFNFKVLRNFCSVKIKHLQNLQNDDCNNNCQSCCSSIEVSFYRRLKILKTSTSAAIVLVSQSTHPTFSSNKNLSFST